MRAGIRYVKYGAVSAGRRLCLTPAYDQGWDGWTGTLDRQWDQELLTGCSDQNRTPVQVSLKSRAQLHGPSVVSETCLSPVRLSRPPGLRQPGPRLSVLWSDAKDTGYGQTGSRETTCIVMYACPSVGEVPPLGLDTPPWGSGPNVVRYAREDGEKRRSMQHETHVQGWRSRQLACC